MKERFLTAVTLVIFIIAFSTMFVCGAEAQDPQYISDEAKEVEIYSNGTTAKIANLASGLNNVTDVRGRAVYTKAALIEAGVDDETVSNMPEQALRKVSEAENIVIQRSSPLWGDRLVDEATKTYDSGDFEIYSVLLSSGDTIIQNGISYMIYETQVWAAWYKMPIYRLTDVLAVTASNITIDISLFIVSAVFASSAPKLL